MLVLIVLLAALGFCAVDSLSPPVAMGNYGWVDMNCYDDHRCCRSWSRDGVCNTPWMMRNCRASCRRCNPPALYTQMTCTDKFSECGQWAAQGACDYNYRPSEVRDFMNLNCPTACNSCSYLSVDSIFQRCSGIGSYKNYLRNGR